LGEKNQLCRLAQDEEKIQKWFLSKNDLSLLPLQKEQFFHWDNAPVAIAPFLKQWFADHSIEHLWHSTSHQALLLGISFCFGG
jgi:hypothetical protein